MEQHVKRLLALGSVAYAAGFLTVTIHTFRIGVPVTELGRAIYVWVGLPLALIAWALALAVGELRTASSRASGHASRARLAALRLRIPNYEEASETLLQTLRAYATESWNWTIKISLRMVVIPLYSWILGRAAVSSPRPALVVALRGVTALVRGLLAVFAFTSPAMSAAALGMLGALYVGVIYPLVPRGLGGGAAVNARVTLKSEALDTSDPYYRMLIAGDSVESEPGPLVTLSVVLLHESGKEYFFRGDSGRVLALPRAAVTAIEW